MEGCGPINDTALCSGLFVSFAVLAQAWRHLSRSLAPARDKEAKSGDGARAKDANRMIGVALSTIGLRALDRSRQGVSQVCGRRKAPLQNSRASGGMQRHAGNFKT